MAKSTTRRLEYHDRFALQQADQAIRKDVVRALVELITNSNDSYHRLQDTQARTSGLIIIEINRKRKNSLVRVRDFAEGMSGETMNDKVGTYGAPTSGFLEGQSVRGLWGRGLKDAFYGLGHGTVTSIYNGKLYQCALFTEDGAPMYEPPRTPKPVTDKLREKHQIPSGDGTIAEIYVSRPDVPMPRFDTLRFKLQQHFELRTIMNNPSRHVFLREVNNRGKIKQEVKLSHRNPTGIRIYNEGFYIPGYPALVHLEIYRSDEPLTTVSEVGDFADGGLLVVSKRVVMALTLLKYEHSEYASRVYGTITCDYLHELLQKEETEPVLSATRDGLNWDHPFMQAMRKEIEARLEPLIEAERRLAQQSATVVVDKRLRKRFNSALRRLNSIANSVLVGRRDGAKPTRPDIPFNGFGFINEFASVQSGRRSGLTLRAELSEDVKEGELVTVTCESEEVKVLTPQVEIRPRKDFPDIGEARVQIEGRQVGAEAILSAHANGLNAEALVKVVSKRKPSASSSNRSFITDIEFSPTADPRQRALYDREASKVIIATRAPSVEPYLGEGGAGANTPQGQVLLAELVSEVLFREIARVGVQTGKLPAFHDSMEASVQAHFQRLQHEFGGDIHNYFVDSQFRNPNGDK